MQRVAELAHVKAPTAPPAASAAVRVAWHGGKISSNKEEALRKFLERKARAGDQRAMAQIRATQSRLGLEQDGGVDKAAHTANHKKNRRPHAKVQETSAHKTIVINGRVVGPKVKQQKARPAHVVVKTATNKRGNNSKSAKAASSERIALEKQLDLPLDALLKRKG